MHQYRSHTCENLRKRDVEKTARLSGWVHRVRDHGGILFIDLRDHYGVTQVVIDPGSEAFRVAETVRSEWVVCIDGTVKARNDDTVNTDIPTGEIEIYAHKIEVLSTAKDLPFPIFGEPDYPEDIRLEYRFLDLRRETLHSSIVRRAQIIAAIREQMSRKNFIEFQTPVLTSSSPEGARDFLVPSRMYPGKFYALPQAPQQFKQLIMMGGFDRYFQIAPCFRDEDPRADRLPGEFYQLDIEMSFVEQNDVLETMEPVIRSIFEAFAGEKTVTKEFPRIPYAVAMRKYGTDKPDLRNPIEMESVTEHFAGSGFRVFANMIEQNSRTEVWAIPAKTGGSRAFCDQMNSWAQKEGQPGLGYIFWRMEGDTLVGAGPIAKNIGDTRTQAIRKQLKLENADACFFIAGEPEKFTSFASKARVRTGKELGLIDRNRFELCWIIDFPMYEWDEKNKKIDFSHNPFSMPQGGLEALSSLPPLELKADQYDMVCNGFEIASGAIRNYKPEVMEKVFEIAGYDKRTLEERFGALYRAFQYGAPPHGGMAAGIDRIIMLLCAAKNLREITVFPMNQQAQDLQMKAPGEVTASQMMELGLRVLPGKQEKQ